MADFRLRAGEYRPSETAGLFGQASTAGNPDVPAYHYEGPHGPLEVYAVDGLTATEVRGPALASAPVRLGWGLRAHTGDWKGRLQDGLTCVVEGAEVTLSQRRSGFSRGRRALEISAGGHRLVARARGLARQVVERADGTAVARFPSGLRGEGWIDDGAGLVEVVVVVLLQSSGLLEENALGWLP